jgi:hypothetical protein
VVRGPLDRPGFEALLSEGPGPAPGLSSFDSALGLSVRRWCAPLLDLPAHAEPDDYLSRRADLGDAEVARRMLGAAGFAALLVDGGYRPDDLFGDADLAAAAGAPVHRVLRLESVAEAVADAGAGAGGYAAAVEAAVHAALTDTSGAGHAGHAGRAGRTVGLKSVAAYRCGLDLDPAPPEAAEVRAAADRWLPRRVAGGASVPLADPVLVRHLLWTGLRTGLPLQLHTGFGDPDEDLHRANPALLAPFCRASAPLGVPVLLLHCYPYQREAAWMAHVFPHVYVDVGLASTYVGARAPEVFADLAETAPYGKILYSSDGFGLPELHLLGAIRFRQSCRRFADALINSGEARAADVDRILDMIAVANARRVYALGDPPGEGPQ